MLYPIIDAHQHFWKYNPIRDAWITDEMKLLQQDFLPPDIDLLFKENHISGSVVVQAPEHVIDNARAVAKAGDDPKKLKKVQRRKPADGEVSWTEQTYDKLVAARC